MKKKHWVVLKDKHFVTSGEILDNIYECPDCCDHNILSGFDYCPSCGIKLRWQLTE